MSIAVPGSDSVSAMLTNSNTHLKRAISALNAAKMAFTFGSDFDSAARCTALIHQLQMQSQKLSDTAGYFNGTKHTLNTTDQINSNDIYGNIFLALTGMVCSTLRDSLTYATSYTASSGTLAALEAKVYRKNARQLHGFLFEVLYRNKLNLGLRHELFTKASLGPSNAPGKDIILKKYGKVKILYELKAYAEKSASKLKKFVKDNTYPDSKIVATSEAAQKAGEGILDGGEKHGKMLGLASSSRNSTKAMLALKSISKGSVAGAVTAGVFDGLTAGFLSFPDACNGSISWTEYWSRVANRAAVGAATGAVVGGVTTAVLAGAALLPGVTLTGGALFVVSAGIGSLVNWGLSKLFG